MGAIKIQAYEIDNICRNDTKNEPTDISDIRFFVVIRRKFENAVFREADNNQIIVNNM